MPENAPKTLETVEEYLDALRQALAGEDAALVQDACSDAEEYLRAEQEQNPDAGEGALIARAYEEYGAPGEIAESYRAMERAGPPGPRPRHGPPAPAAPLAPWYERFFGIVREPLAYSSLFYMFFALITGIVYFTVAVTGLALSIGLMPLLIGPVIFLLFLGLVRVFSFIEGRIVDVLLGVRMPRRTLFVNRGEPWLQRIKDVLMDRRTWSTILYMVLQLPLGIAYFTSAVTALAVSISFIIAPVLYVGGLIFGTGVYMNIGWEGDGWLIDFLANYELLFALLMIPLGAVGVVLTLHLARLVARGHGWLAKNLLVKA